MISTGGRLLAGIAQCRVIYLRERACLTCVFCPVSEDYSEQATGAGQGAKKGGGGTVAGDREGR